MRTRTLYVLRHAKSSWDEPIADFDRRLAARGRHAVGLLATHLRDGDCRPEIVLCSPARRAVETLEPLRDVLGDPEVRLEDGLYGASAPELFDCLRTLGDRVSSAMLVGHNPGLHDLVLDLAASGAGLNSVREKFPTAALASIAFDRPWNELEPDCARLTGFVRPRDLPGV